jgi:P-type E1-E2 ATPase
MQYYREHMQQFALMNHLDVWYYHLDVEGILAMTRSMVGRRKLQKGVQRYAKKASRRTRIETFPKLAEVVDGKYRIIFIIVQLSNILNFVQTYRSQKAVDQLGVSVAPTATALRDGEWIEIPRSHLVPGDMIRLTAGDMVPADARLVQTNDLQVQQAALTGESQPVEKTADDLSAPTERLAEVHNRVFLGTSVMSGSATALVTATGRTTAFGDIAASLASKPPQTEFERGMTSFSLLIVRTVLFLVLFIFLVGIIAHHRPLETILFAISLAVGLTPEGLPAVTMITLAVGAQRMAKKKVIVKFLEAIENFGSIDTFCSDKTGTLTSGETQLQAYLDLSHQASDRVLLFGNLNCAYDTGIKSPLDDAILQYGKVETSGYSKAGEIPFDFNRRRLSVIVQHGDELLLVTKGAPESVLPSCSAYELNDVNKPLDDTARAHFVKMYQDLNTQGYRALAPSSPPFIRLSMSWNTVAFVVPGTCSTRVVMPLIIARSWSWMAPPALSGATTWVRCMPQSGVTHIWLCAAQQQRHSRELSSGSGIASVGHTSVSRSGIPTSSTRS